MQPLRHRGSLVGILFISSLLALTLPLAAGEDEGSDPPFPITSALPDLTPPPIAEEDEIIDPPFPIPSLLPDVIPSALAAGEYDASNVHFPRPPVLSANVDFWKRVYTEFGVGDFVLHDRDHLAIIYDVVQVGGIVNERRASDAAAPEIRRLRVRYEGILTSLAYGVAPEDLGPDGLRVAQAWGCPCAASDLRRAASNIRIQQGLREKVDEGMERARALMPQILSVLHRHNLPHELAALPMVESSFNPRARSKAGAVGMWQIIRSTGKLYLNITRQRDDRHDPIRATDAAARLLKHNYGALGSWPLALLAYNHGKEGVRVAKETVGTSAVEDIIVCYNGRRFGFASRNFYPEFLAALDLLQPVIHTSTQQTRNLKRHSRLDREG